MAPTPATRLPAPSRPRRWAVCIALAVSACEEKPAPTPASTLESSAPALFAMQVTTPKRATLDSLAGAGASIVLTFDERDGRSLVGAHAPVPKETTPPLANLVLLEKTAAGFRKLAQGVGAAAFASDGAILYLQGDALVEEKGGATKLVTRPVASEFAIDPSGNWLAVVRPGVAYQSAIELVTRGGSNKRLLAPATGTHGTPIFTPDGKALVFSSGRTGTVSLWRIDLDGSGERQLTNREPAAASAMGPTFTPPPISSRGMRFLDARTLEYDGGEAKIRVDVESGKRAP